MIEMDMSSFLKMLLSKIKCFPIHNCFIRQIGTHNGNVRLSILKEKSNILPVFLSQNFRMTHILQFIYQIQPEGLPLKYKKL